MRKRAKKDTNHNTIAQALIDVGYSVADTSQLGGNFPDLVVGGTDRKTGQIANWLIEIKTEKGKVKPGQNEFAAQWRGVYAVVRTVDEAYKLVGVL
jgi:hypothetical protein